MPMIAKTFDERVRKSPNGCWHWTGHIERNGYGSLSVDRKPYPVHRYAYERHHGVQLAPRGTPDHRQVDHDCHNRSKSCPGGVTCLHRRCVNPAHLLLRTARENTEASEHATAHIGRRKTHCVHDHEFTPENTYRKPNGSRACRICKRESNRRRRRRSR